MKIISIFNFPNDDNYNSLCDWWLQNALKYSDLPIEVWYEDNKPAVWKPSDRVSYLQKERLDIEPLLPNNLVSDKSKHNVGFKLHNLCSEVEPFIFIDADAIVLKDIQPLIEASKRKPFITVDHQDIPGHTSHIPFKFLNSGLQVCSDPAILDFKNILHYQNLHTAFLCPGTDQSMLYTYFGYIDYDYTDPEIDWRWNNCAGFCRDLEEISINHYWYKFKPWTIECPAWKDFLHTKENK